MLVAPSSLVYPVGHVNISGTGTPLISDVPQYDPFGHLVHSLLLAGEYVPAGHASQTAYNVTLFGIFHVIFVLLDGAQSSPVPSAFVFHFDCVNPFL